MTLLAILLLFSPTEREAAVDEFLEQTPVVVTALRRPESIFKTAYSVDSIGRDRVVGRQYRNTPQVFRDTPGVMVQETAPGQGSPYIRGFTGYRNLFLIDGVRLNNSTFRDGPNQYWSTVDAFSVQSFEIVRGPSSVLFGSDAIGGTVNARTINPYAYGRSETWGFAGRTLYRGSTAENSHILRGEISVTYGDKAGLVAGATPKTFGDLIAGSPRGRQKNIGYDEFAGDLKMEFQLGDGSRLVFLYQYVQQNNVPRWHKTADNDTPFHGTTTGNEIKRENDQERRLAYVQWHKTDIGDFIDAVHVNVSWHQQDEVRDRLRTGGRADTQGTKVGTLGAWVQLQTNSAVGRFIYGAEWYHDSVNSFSSRNPIQGPVADNASYDTLGIYVQDEIDFSDRAGIVLGVRFNYAAVDADKVADPITGNQISVRDDWSAFVGSIRGRYELVPDKWSVFGGISQGFRAPNLSDLTRFDSARSNEFEIPSTDLDPEFYTQYEVGLKAQLKTFTLQSSVFYTSIRDQIVRIPTGATTPGGEEVITKDNIGDGWTWGFELGASWRFLEEWTLFGNVTYLNGKVDTFATSAPVKTREYISRLMPLTGQIGVRWDDSERRFWAETYMRMAGKADRLSTRDQSDTQRIPPGGTPGYGVWSVRTGWNITPKMAAIIGLENLLNKSYRVHGSGQNMAGFNFIFTFTADF